MAGHRSALVGRPARRADVSRLRYSTQPVRISGAPIADLFAATTGTDADWVVKLIDVFPDEVPSQPELGGYQLAVSMDIFRGRYRESFENPTAIPAGKPQRYRFTLPTTNHVFEPGHRIMVQIQSSWFPLYDRNPQTYVAEHLLREAGGLCQGDPVGLPLGRPREFCVAARRPVNRLGCRYCGKSSARFSNSMTGACVLEPQVNE